MIDLEFKKFCWVGVQIDGQPVLSMQLLQDLTIEEFCKVL